MPESSSKNSLVTRIGKISLAVFGPLILLGLSMGPLFAVFGPSNDYNAHNQITPEQIQVEIEGYEEVLVREPNNEFALSTLVRLNIELQDYEAALPHVTKLLELQPDNESYQLTLARLKVRTQDAPGAVALYQELYEQNPENPTLFQELLDAQVQADDADSAIALINQQLATDPDSRSLQLQLARIYAQVARTDEAIEIYDNLIAEDETDYTLVLSKALALSTRAQDEAVRAQVESLFDEAIALAPEGQQKREVELMAQQVFSFYDQLNSISTPEASHPEATSDETSVEADAPSP